MPRGRTTSTLNLRQRRDKAFDLFLKGYDDTEVAKRLKVTRQTASNYRRSYEARLHHQAEGNPTMLREVLENTMRSLVELDKVRSEAWRNMEDRLISETKECPECGAEVVFQIFWPVNDTARAGYLNVLLKAQDQRSKLFGVIGIKADMLVAVAEVQTIQRKIIDYLMRELPADQKTKLEAWMVAEIPQFAESSHVLDVVDGEIISETT